MSVHFNRDTVITQALFKHFKITKIASTQNIDNMNLSSIQNVDIMSRIHKIKSS